MQRIMFGDMPKKSEKLQQKKTIRQSNPVFFLLLFITMQLRYFADGFQYFMYTDDNNQYGVYFRRAMQGDIWNNIIMHYQRFIERPFAFFSDAYVFQRFYPNMQLLLILICTMHFFICYLTYKTFTRLNIRFSLFAVLLIALMPCGYEAAYWISASSRIVVSMFFGCLSIALYFDAVHFGGRSLPRRAAVSISAITGLFSLLYYEQTALFSFTLFFVCSWIHVYGFGSQADTRAKVITFLKAVSIPIINILLTACYYLYFMLFSVKGTSESRNKIVTENFVQKIAETTQELAELVSENIIEFNSKAIGLGLQMDFKPLTAFFLLFAVALAVLLFFREGPLMATLKLKRHKQELPEFAKALTVKLGAGIVLFFAPLSVFYLLKNVYYEPRMLFPSLIGIALILDCLFDGMEYFYPPLTLVKRVSGSILAILFFVAGVYITDVYRQTYDMDNRIASDFISAYYNATGIEISYEVERKSSGADRITTSQQDTKYKVFLFNTVYNYKKQTPNLANIVSADWIMLGKLNSFLYSKQNFKDMDVDKLNQMNYYFQDLTLVRDYGYFDVTRLMNDDVLILGIKDGYDSVGDTSIKIIPLKFFNDNSLRMETGEVFGSFKDGVFVKKQ